MKDHCLNQKKICFLVKDFFYDTGIKRQVQSTVKPVNKDYGKDQQHVVFTCRWSLEQV